MLFCVMALCFPNRSRSYSSSRRCVRFWAHDEALEISFFVDADAFCPSGIAEAWSENAILDAFDRHLDSIHAAALRVYARYGKASYILTAADCNAAARP